MDLLRPYLDEALTVYQRCLRSADAVVDEAQADARYAAKRARDGAEEGLFDEALRAAEEAAAADPHWQPLLAALQRLDRADRALLAAEEDADGLRAADDAARTAAWTAAADRHELDADDDDLRRLYLRAL